MCLFTFQTEKAAINHHGLKQSCKIPLVFSLELVPAVQCHYFFCAQPLTTHSQLGRVSHLHLLNNPFACLCYWHDCNFNHKDSWEISEELPTESCMIVTWLEWSNGFLLAALIKNHLLHQTDGEDKVRVSLKVQLSVCVFILIFTPKNLSDPELAHTFIKPLIRAFLKKSAEIIWSS